MTNPISNVCPTWLVHSHAVTENRALNLHKQRQFLEQCITFYILIAACCMLPIFQAMEIRSCLAVFWSLKKAGAWGYEVQSTDSYSYSIHCKMFRYIEVTLLLASIHIRVDFDNVVVCSTREGTSKVVRGPIQLIVWMSSRRVHSYTLGELDLGVCIRSWIFATLVSQPMWYVKWSTYLSISCIFIQSSDKNLSRRLMTVHHPLSV